MKLFKLFLLLVLPYLCGLKSLIRFYILTKLNFESIDNSLKFNQNSINAIFQDSKGFMWFGTQMVF